MGAIVRSFVVFPAVGGVLGRKSGRYGLFLGQSLTLFGYCEVWQNRGFIVLLPAFVRCIGCFVVYTILHA